MDARQSGCFGKFPPQFHEVGYVPIMVWVVDGKYRLAVDGDIPMVSECGEHIVEVGRVVLITAIHHWCNHLSLAAVLPCLGSPFVVSPAKAKGKGGLARSQHLVEGPLQQLLAVAHPIMIVAETLDASLAGHPGLLLTHLGQPEVVETEVGGDAWLVVATK